MAGLNLASFPLGSGGSGERLWPRLTTVVMVLACLVAVPISAQVVTVAKGVREVVEEGVEKVLGRAARDGAEEAVKLGGRAGVRETMERAAAEGGEGLVRKVTAYGVEHGPAGLRVVGRSPARMVAVLDDLAPSLRGPAIRAIEREPEVLLPLIEKNGPAALEAAVRHPGVGATLGQKLGAEGIEASRALTTDQAVVVARHADEIAALPAAERSAVLERIRGSTTGAISFLERHPRTLLTAAGVTAFLVAKDELLEPPTFGPDGKRTGGGIVYGIWDDVFGVLKSPLGIAAGILVATVAVWSSLRLWHTWRVLKMRSPETRQAAG